MTNDELLSLDLLKGRSILITGGGSGLGLALAAEFRRLGARVALWGRTRERLENGAATLPGSGDEVIIDTVDVRDFDAVGAAMRSLQSRWGTVDGLVNNAAGNFLCASEELSASAFKTVIDIVLVGTFNCSRHFGSLLIEQGKPGSILNIATTYTDTGSAFVLPSASAKGGVVALTGSLAFEWAEYGIRVNAVAPGPFPTEGAWKRLIPDGAIEEEWRLRHPMKRFGSQRELAGIAAVLMSDLASFINGACIDVDGGERLSSGQFNFLASRYPREQLKAIFRAMKPAKPAA